MTHDELMQKHYNILGRLHGLEICDGWLQLIDDLCTKLTALNPKDGPGIRAVQVKSKFGGLRFYVDHCTLEQDEAINEAERLSYKTCEICGKPGKHINKQGWIVTACDEHS
jgi:hypothetical protein